MFPVMASGGTSTASESQGWILMVTATPAYGCSRVSSIRVTPTTGKRYQMSGFRRMTSRAMRPL